VLRKFVIVGVRTTGGSVGRTHSRRLPKEVVGGARFRLVLGFVFVTFPMTVHKGINPGGNGGDVSPIFLTRGDDMPNIPQIFH